MQAPNDKLPVIYNLEIITEDAQFGINPTKSEKRGANTAFDLKKV